MCILTLILSRRLHRLMRKDPQKSKNSSVLLTDSCLNNSMNKHNLVLKTSICSLQLSPSRTSGLHKFSPTPNLASINSQNCTLHLVVALLLAIAVKIPVHRKKCPNSSWFHSASTSVSMFEINADICLFLCCCLRHLEVECGIHCQ